MFKYKDKTTFAYNIIQNVVHCRKFSMKQNVDVSCSELGWTYIHIVSLFHLNHQKNARLSRIFSRTKVIFQGFSGPENFQEKSRTFRETWEPCISYSQQSTITRLPR